MVAYEKRKAKITVKLEQQIDKTKERSKKAPQQISLEVFRPENPKLKYQIL